VQSLYLCLYVSMDLWIYGSMDLCIIKHLTSNNCCTFRFKLKGRFLLGEEFVVRLEPPEAVGGRMHAFRIWTRKRSLHVTTQSEAERDEWAFALAQLSKAHPDDLPYLAVPGNVKQVGLAARIGGRVSSMVVGGSNGPGALATVANAVERVLKKDAEAGATEVSLYALRDHLCIYVSMHLCIFVSLYLHTRSRNYSFHQPTNHMICRKAMTRTKATTKVTLTVKCETDLAALGPGVAVGVVSTMS
jgi:hypothetical protein